MDDETANLNPPKTLEKKNPRTESSVNSKDCMNWMIYTLFLKYVKIEFNIGIRRMLDTY